MLKTFCVYWVAVMPMVVVLTQSHGSQNGVCDVYLGGSLIVWIDFYLFNFFLHEGSGSYF